MNTTTSPQTTTFPTVEQQLARRDAEKFYDAAMQAMGAGYDEHADKMLDLWMEALRHVGPGYDRDLTRPVAL